MLTLIHGSSCDVCAEEYGALRLPHSIPCGKFFFSVRKFFFLTFFSVANRPRPVRELLHDHS